MSFAHPDQRLLIALTEKLRRDFDKGGDAPRMALAVYAAGVRDVQHLTSELLAELESEKGAHQ